MTRLTLLLLFLLLADTQKAVSQFSFGLSGEEEVFLFRVKMMDEFIERFNDPPTSFIRREFKKRNADSLLTRKKMLVTLFNWQNQDFYDTSLVIPFIDRILDTSDPVYVHFKDSSWYAVAQCQFVFQGKELAIPLILHVRHNVQRETKWMITGIGNHPIFAGQTLNPSILARKKGTNQKYISPKNYAVDFTDLLRIFSDSMVQEDFFDPDLLTTERAKIFVQMIKQGTLKFTIVSDLKYYFYQVPGYFFIVEDFKREAKNSGWLINTLIAVTPEEKQKIKQRMLEEKM